MRQKTAVFASQGALDTSLTDSDYATGMIAGTVAMAEDVNTYGNRSDVQLKVVSDELCNAIIDQGIQLDNNDNAQLSKVLKEKIGGAALLTGIVYDSVGNQAPTLSNNVLSFPEFNVQFNNKVFYGDKQADFTTVNVQSQTLSATNSWQDGAYFIYVNNSGVITYQRTPVLAEDGATKCFLGSVFVVNGAMQDGSWSYSPWLQQSSIATRSAPTSQIKGGLVVPRSGTTVSIGAIQIFEEGINFGVNKFDPNIKTVQSQSPMKYKFLYPGYNPAFPEQEEIVTDHIYNMTDGTWDTIPEGTTGFVVMIPCITPTGQTLMIPPMSPKSGETYANIFASQRDAENAVFSLQYQLGSVADRVIYLGQAIIVEIGATDLTDHEQFEVYGVVPQSLAGFTNQGGQTGGGTGGFIPMREVTLSGSTISLRNQTSNIIQASATTNITLTFPTIESGVLNQLEVKFLPNSNQLPGIQFPSGEVLWKDNFAPDILANTIYNFVFEYDRNANKWVGGWIEASL